MALWGSRNGLLGLGLLAVACLFAEGRGSAEPAARVSSKVVSQIYQGQLDGQEVWVELTRTAQGGSGKLGNSLQTAGALTVLELPAPAAEDMPPAFIPQRLNISPCKLSVAGTHPQGLIAACLTSMQGDAFITEGFPALIVEDAPGSSGKSFWLRAVARETAEALAKFGAELQRAEPKDKKACVRSVRIDQTLRIGERTFLAYWTWDFCGAALLSAVRADKAEPGEGPWRETAWLGVSDASGSVVSHVAVGKRALANDALTLKDLGRLDGLNVLTVERDSTDLQSTSVRSYSQTRVYAAPDRGALTLALDPPASFDTASNCWGSNLESDLFRMSPDAPADELILRTIKTDRIYRKESCDSKKQTSYRGYRFNPKTNKYVGFQRSGLADLVRAQLAH